MKKWIKCLVVMFLISISIDIISFAATDLSSEIYTAQEGSTTCTLASATMMLRARFYKSNNDTWRSITESGIREIAWIGGKLRHSWTYKNNNDSISVSHNTTSGISINSLKSLLNNHPEGIVLYCGNLPHAVFLTDYEGDTFYCADPIQSYSGKRITLSSSYLGKKYGSQASILSQVTAYWYVSSYTINTSEPSNPYYNSYGFDNPSDNEVITEGTFLFQGWINAKKEISTITCSINHGVHYIEGSLYERSDVPDATAFRAEVDSNLLNLGNNDVALCVNFTDGSATVVANRTVTWSPKLLWGFDSPTENLQISDDLFQFSGWIETGRKLNHIICNLNHGEEYLTANLYKRSDVPNAIAFRLDIESSKLHYGENYVAVCACYTDGTEEIIAERRVMKNINDAIEYPNNNEKFTCKDPWLLLQGWSVNDNKQIDHFEFVVNEIRSTTAAYARSDLPENARYYREEIPLEWLKNGKNGIEVFVYYTDGTSRNVGQREVIGDLDHKWDKGNIIQTATCVDPEIKIYTCTNCQTTKTEEFPATGHQNTELRNAKEATCVSEGYTGDTYCKDCGTKLSTGQVITKKVHVWDAGKITQEATCIEAGVKTYTCTNCNTARTEEIPATGNHKNTELRNAKEAMCTSEGYTGDTYCKDCGMKLSTGQVITKKVHIWDAGKITQETTCVEAGVKTYTCTNCNTTRTEKIAATGHVTKITKFAKEATCKIEGYSGDVYCQVCGTMLEEGKVLPKKEHSWNKGEITAVSTCITAGVKTYTCTLCGSTKTEEIAATGHVTKVTKFAKEATCKTEGYSGDVYCQDCGSLLEEGKVLPKAEHSWNEGEITTAATCTVEGTKTFTCTVCKETKIEKIPAKGHGATEVRNRKDATCRAEGYTGDTYCTVCGEVISKGETVAKAGHGATEVRNRKDATCGAEGYTGDTYCTVCGEVISKGETVAKVSHGATEVRNRKDATCRAEGYTGDTYCTVCGEIVSKGEATAKTDHSWDAGKITKQPTTTETGTKTFTCQSCGLTRTETMAKLEEKQLTPGKTVKSKATNGVYKVLKDGRSVEFTKPIVKRASVKIPATIKINGITCKVTGISAGAFKNNTSLRTVTIGKNVTSIGTNAFYGCKKLTRIIGGSAVTKIGDKAFYSCSTLTSITIPAGVNKIGKMAFYNCKKLRTIVVKTSKLTSRNIGTKAFTGTYAKANIKVPTKQLNTYKKLFKSKGMGSKAVYKK